MRTPLPFLLILGLAAACSEPEPPPGAADAGLPDAAADAGEPDAGEVVCGPGERAKASGECVKVGWRTCAEGFEAAASGWGCTEILPSEPCAPGTFPVLGERECQPVGTRECVAGFEADPSGWGCRPVLPAAPCEGATREQLGSTACVPLGDCAAPFPPAEATLFVDDGYTAAELDATHFATISEAIAAAAQGATIAVEEGTYREPLTLERPVKLVGRCAEKVVLEGALDGERGVIVIGAAAIAELSGFTVTNFDYGVLVKEGARLELADSLVTANRGIGLLVQQEGTYLRMLRSVTRGNLLNSSNKLGDGVVAIFGGELVFEESASVGNRTAGVMAQDPSTRVALLRAVIRDTAENGVGVYGAGVIATSSSEVSVEGSALEGGRLAGVELIGGATGTVRDSTIFGVQSGTDPNGNRISSAILVQGGAVTVENATLADCDQHALNLSLATTATVRDSVIRGTRVPSDGVIGIAVGVASNATLALSGSAVVDNHGVAVIAQTGAALAVSDLLVRGTLPQVDREATGLGLSVRDGGQLTALRLALVENAANALSVMDPGTAASVEGLVIRDTKTANLVDGDSRYGIGVRVIEASLELRRAAILRSAAGAMLLDSPGTVVTVADAVFKDTLPTERGTHGYGVAVQFGPQLVLERVGLFGSGTAALETWGDSAVTMREVTVSGTRSDALGDYGHGLVFGGGTATLSDVAVRDSDQVGIIAISAGTQVEAVDSLILGQGLESAVQYGYGLNALQSARAVLRGCTVAENPGVGVLFSSATGAVDGSRIERNGIALNVDGASTVTERATVPGEIPVNEVVVTSDSVFRENLTRLGAGSVPIPTLPGGF